MENNICFIFSNSLEPLLQVQISVCIFRHNEGTEDNEVFLFFEKTKSFAQNANMREKNW